jgi:hypothetical protein
LGYDKTGIQIYKVGYKPPISFPTSSRKILHFVEVEFFAYVPKCDELRKVGDR